VQAQEQWIIEILKTEPSFKRGMMRNNFQGHTGSILANAASGTNKSPSDTGSLQYSVERNYLSLMCCMRPVWTRNKVVMPIDF
jgi:hypothetical protein